MLIRSTRFLCACLGFLMLDFGYGADSPPIPIPIDSTILHKSLTFFNEAQNWHIQFTTVVKSELSGESNTYRGDLWSAEKNKFRLKLGSDLYVSNGKHYWELHSGTKQFLIKNFEQAETAPDQVLLNFMKALPTSLEKITVNKKSLWKLKMDPQSAPGNLQALTVFLSFDTVLPERMETVDAADNKVSYTLQKLERNKKVSDDLFTLNAPKGYETVDMRL